MGLVADLYSPPDAHATGRFLGRYRRPLAQPLVEAYLAAWTAPGDLVLDPFCQDPTVVRAAVAAGRRGVAISGNPLLALLARVEAAPPPAARLEAALQEIRYAPKVDVPLGDHLDQLYATTCSHCRHTVPAAAFIWDRRAGAPLLREYACPHCQHRARESVPGEEVARHLAHDTRGFHRRLVGERLRIDGERRRLLERLLGLYTPRNLYALTALVLKLEVLFADSPLLDPLRSALLHTMDLASNLNQATEEGWRPVGSLRPPRHFREANVWQTFAGAIQSMAAQTPPPGLALATSLEPALGGEGPAPGLAYVGADSLPRLAARLPGKVALALGQLPRFDPTFAALSYLWSGWLLGKEGSRGAAHLLRQRTPEESRYLRALQSALAALGPALGLQGRLALAFQAPATRYLESLLLAAATAGLRPVHAWHGMLDDRPAAGFAVRPVEHHLVFARPGPHPPPGDRAARAQTLAVRTAQSVLAQRAEPAPFGALHGPIWDALAREGLLGGSRTAGEAEALRRRLDPAIGQALADDAEVLLPLSTAGDEGQTVWWLRSPPPEARTLAERLEEAVRAALLPGRTVDEAALAREVLEQFPGGLAPSWPLWQACLEAYGARLSPRRWALAEAEEPAPVAERRRGLLAALEALGVRLGYEVGAPAAGERQGMAVDHVVTWLEEGTLAFEFLLRDTAELADLCAQPPLPAGRRVLVIPQRRVGLWRHRLQAAPPWAAALERAGWALLPEGEVLNLLAEAADRARFLAALGLAQHGQDSAQLSLFSNG